jgi:quinol-cytochrome oxidoreductase complex cytochrome b subunit
MEADYSISTSEILLLPDMNLGQVTVCPHWGFLWIYSVIPGEIWDSIVKLVMAVFFPVISISLNMIILSSHLMLHNPAVDIT